MPTTMTCERPATAVDPYTEPDWFIVEEEPPCLTRAEFEDFKRKYPTPQAWYEEDQEDMPF